ncbi:agmatine deiminase family protein [Cryobacterium levicorallinum]|uniref:Agmatine deiminase n=1 Tax=Cryobacterium levicorallinum TaxID=995038 RepID=A0A1I2ZQE5_9MICO|nr:agmatine deiminase family protein [Cryobacterium levicorallinum]TFB89647.1 agmatine deiminase family protein [Cryobacterium levicorallinum]SFH40067.1 agmatine deiminase [Cryobacterium levicorallinum]
MTWCMPAETAPQDRVWMAFPVGGYTLGYTATEAHEAHRTWAAVAHAVAEFEPVRMVVDPAERAVARRYLSAEIEVLEAPLNDSWMRDIGPSFVHDDTGRLGAVDWTFNGWGGQDWATWDHDSKISRFVANAAGAAVVSSALVNEGGGIHVDGAGTVLATESVQLDSGRNPGATRASVEEELRRTIGAEHVVWLPRGLTRDHERFGTRGHIDMVAALPSPGTILLHAQNDPGHPDYPLTREFRGLLAGAHDAAGRSFTIIDLPAPAVLRDDEGFVDYNYVNHLVVNGGVIACSFGEERSDSLARDVLAAAYPGRRLMSVDARPLFARGGGIHCITQQQPSTPLPA